MGHGFQQTLMDTLIRYHRMRGNNTLWQGGTDHAGIATQMVVERQLLQQGLKRQDLGREAFVERIWEWKHQSDNVIKTQMRRLGNSMDWSRERFTMDDTISTAVREAFIRLYDEGIIYRGKYLVNWDPVLRTAVSDLEVVTQEEEGSLWYLRYPLVGSDDVLIVATTRPETLLGDTAVAVNPTDPRYQHLIGQQVRLPISERLIPVIADDYVDPEFGSGCVKITPAHDFNDYRIGIRHNLPMINVFTPDAHLNEHAPPAYEGLDRVAARQKIITDLEQQGFLEKVTPHTLQVPRGDRSGAILEPYLTDQWYVNAKVLAEPAIAAVQQGEIIFVPDNWRKTYFQWLENIQDWCISRQLWWGHRIPAWYDTQGNIYVADSETAVRHKYHLTDDVQLHQDNDVLDTWFSSALWPFATLGWPEKTPDLTTFYPTQVLITGFDIIFFWVARMVMMGLKFTGKVPFETVYITGLIRDSEGHKMSKSKGNIIDPIDLIDGITLEDLVAKRTQGLMQPAMAKKIEAATRKEFPQGIPAYGTDALRFTFCALANTGRDIRFDFGRIEGYRNFCNKLWNATRYVLMNTENATLRAPTELSELHPVDRWMYTRLQQTIARATEAFEQFRFDFVAQTLYEFVWNEYCDWYLELSKPLLADPNIPDAQKALTRHTLLNVLEISLRLLHPLMPFITEEIWAMVAPQLNKTSAHLMTEVYPQADAVWEDISAVESIECLKGIVMSIRNIRGEMNIAPNKLLPLYIRRGEPIHAATLATHTPLILSLAKLASIHKLGENETPPASATAFVGALELFVPMSGLIDKQAEVARLTRELAKLEKELTQVQGKLNNKAYVEKAPAHVVAKERQRAQEVEATLHKLRHQLTQIEEMA